MFWNVNFSVIYSGGVLGESEKSFTRLQGCGVNSMRVILKTEMLIYQLSANVDAKIRPRN